MTRSVIVHLAPFLQGGAGRAISTLACAQQRAGHHVIVATSKTAEPGFENYREYLEAVRRAGCALIEVDSLFKRDRDVNAVAARAVLAALDGRSPSVIHAHAAIPARIGQQLGAPVLQTMHGWSRRKSAAHTAEDLSIMRELPLVVFPSRASLQEVQSLGGESRRAAIVPNGIAAAAPAAPLPALLADVAGRRKDGTKVLLSIGSLTAQKNHRAIIAALPQIVRGHDIVAVLVGEGPELDSLAAQARALGVADRVRLVGYLPEAASVLAIADVLIQPSLAESLGVAVIEAFRAGVPVAVNRIPALIELVGNDERGWTFDASAPGTLVIAVERMLASRDEGRTQRARRYFEEGFTDDRMIAAYCALYSSL